jgi:hypothetical protein
MSIDTNKLEVGMNFRVESKEFQVVNAVYPYLIQPMSRINSADLPFEKQPSRTFNFVRNFAQLWKLHVKNRNCAVVSTSVS